jgi:hypothetical protein
MSAMTTDAAVTPERPPGTGEPLVVSVVVAAGVVVGFLFFDHWWSRHGLETIVRVWGSASFDAYLFIIAMVPAVLLAIVLAIWGIDARHRFAGALAALAAGLIDWGLQELLQRYLFGHGHTSQSTLLAYDWLVTLTIPTLATIAWGLGRRRGVAWWLGVPVAPLLAGLHHQAERHWVPFQTWQVRHDQWWVHGLEFLVPIVAACVVCWLIDSAATRRTAS